MLPANFNLPDAYRGDSYGPIIISLFNSEKNPISVEGASVFCNVGTIGNTRDRKVVLKWPDSTHGIGLSGNQITLQIVPSSAMKMEPEIYYYDLEVTIDGYTRTYIRGNLTVVDEVTNY